MKKLICTLSVFVFLTGCHGAGMIKRPIYEDLSSSRGQTVVNQNIPMYFTQGNVSGQNMGTYVSNKKTNAFNKTPEMSCQIAFLSAIKSLQQRAEQVGARAVVNIHSYYDKNVEFDPNYYRCNDGFLMSGVALRGTMVR